MIYMMVNGPTNKRQTDLKTFRVSGMCRGSITRNNVCLTYRSRPGVKKMVPKAYFLIYYFLCEGIVENTLLLLIYCSILFNYCLKNKDFDMAQGS